MKIKELFEKLGYKQSSVGHVIVYRKNISPYTNKVIMFEPNNFTVFEENILDNGEIDLIPSWISYKELFACIEKFKELENYKI